MGQGVFPIHFLLNHFCLFNITKDTWQLTPRVTQSACNIKFFYEQLEQRDSTRSPEPSLKVPGLHLE